MKVLVTGGAGFIGSHTCVELLNAGYEIVVMDNFSNSKPASLERIKKITGKDFKFYQTDLLDEAGMNKIFDENNIEPPEFVDFRMFSNADWLKPKH